MVLRRRYPDLTRSFRTPGYPLTPVLFVLAAGGVVLSTFVSQPLNALGGIGLILLGVPVYFIFAFKQRPRVE
jgi:APA family basic amino acid/polyamine antiporter